ncbi:uncharacterized protein LOC111410867 [Olea europaea var. sylvestris]|uniref:uncharacterized protein LOC111410867 n=1 Tax=Olea europaea var. sylvestris TaxID=158386 RepID=UPI000C1D0500|nr:uncharacterized protein LOC111410867 [Olea europaea var. sylvestris]
MPSNLITDFSFPISAINTSSSGAEEGSFSNHQRAEERGPQRSSGDGERNIRQGAIRSASSSSHPPAMQPPPLPQMGRSRIIKPNSCGWQIKIVGTKATQRSFAYFNKSIIVIPIFI